MRHLLGTIAACSLLVALASCGTDEGSEYPDLSDGPPPTSTTPSEPTSQSTSQPPSTPSEALEKVRVVGEVVQDGDCVAVEDDNGTTWTIAGEAAAGLVAGDRVQVTGTPDIAAMGCAGPLLKVTRVTPAS
jgi:hypothetical protein